MRRKSPLQTALFRLAAAPRLSPSVFTRAALALLATGLLLPSVTGCNTAGVRFTDARDGERSSSSPALIRQAGNSSGSTDIAIGSSPARTGLKRLGINLSGQTYYDSGQMLRNLVSRNPGFEGEMWQSILQCKSVTPTTCTDGNQYTVWPANFLQGASFEIISGAAAGESGTVLASSLAGNTLVDGKKLGVTLTLSILARRPAIGDFLIVRKDIPGHAQAGWWTSTSGGATLSTEFHDLSPQTPGTQALRISAVEPGQSASVASYFDTTRGHSFVQLRGSYTLSFRAKGIGGSNRISITLHRLDQSRGNETFLSQDVPLSSKWRDYTLSFKAAEDGARIGPVSLSFDVHGASALLDDVSLAPSSHIPDNPTAFRDAVVQTLRDLQPGVLRYMDNGSNFGSSLDNMLAVPFARKRSGSSIQSAGQDDVPIGLNDFLVLCKAVGAEPWYVLQPGASPAEARNLIDYLAGSATTPYGAKRAALGQAAPWTTLFPTIHIELGNEQWNVASFYGATIGDPAAYGERAEKIFAAARTSPSYNPAKFDLILGSWASVPWWTRQEMAHSGQYDSVDAAPYLFDHFDDFSSKEAIFGPMFAQPEMLDSRPAGFMAQQAKAAATGIPPARLAVYEVNLSTISGKAPQDVVNSVVPSLGAGIALADHMLLMMRDLGIVTDAIFSLPEYLNHFSNPADSKETVPLWGAVVDMGGATDLRRPQFLAEQLVNRAILPDLLPATLTGDNPTWDQPLSANDKIRLTGAHFLQAFAFADGSRHSIILFNLSRTQSLPVTFSGPNAPSGRVESSQITSAHITDTNEHQQNVNISNSTLTSFNPSASYALPPFSITTLRWATGIPPAQPKALHP